MHTTKWNAIRLAPRALMPRCAYIRRPTRHGGSRLETMRSANSALEIDLRELGIGYYLPMERKTIRNPKSKKEIERAFPLTPGYAFVRDIHDYAALESAKTVVCVVRCADQVPVVIPEFEIDQLREAEHAINEENRLRQIAAKMNRRQLKKRFPSGSTIRITRGHLLAGEVVTVEAATGRKTIRAANEKIRAMEIGVEFCERVD